MKKSDIILYIVCFLTLIVAMYDLMHLDEIEDDVLGRCNEHWVQEFKDHCSLITENEPIVDWSYNYTNK